MSKAGRRNQSGKRNASQQLPTRGAPNWPLFVLALTGMGLTAYLTVIAWSGQSVAGCTAGSACDAVLSSRWSKLFGLPTSLWGLLAYGGLTGVAWIKRADTRWKWAWAISLFGVLYSGYLTAIALFELNAACPYCLSSATLFLVILGVVIYQRPEGLPKFSWPRWIIKTAAAALVVVLALHLHYTGTWGKTAGRESSELRALAEHLTKTKAQFYGAYWCPHCAQQKEIFGSSAGRLPYVECSPLGPGSTPTKVCQDMGIQGYPTWIINGRRHEGVLTPEELSRYSGFHGASP